jgi:hypothetical protein
LPTQKLSDFAPLREAQGCGCQLKTENLQLKTKKITIFAGVKQDFSVYEEDYFYRFDCPYGCDGWHGTDC